MRDNKQTDDDGSSALEGDDPIIQHATSTGAVLHEERGGEKQHDEDDARSKVLILQFSLTMETADMHALLAYLITALAMALAAINVYIAVVVKGPAVPPAAARSFDSSSSSPSAFV